jgi:hypothetical protein
MDFKQYAEYKRKEAHKEIIKEICMIVNNCADCHDEKTRQTECVPDQRVDLYKVTETSFYIDAYDSKTNRKLLDMGNEYEYKTGIVIEDDDTSYIKFWKE